MAKRSVGSLGPSQRENGFSEAAYTNLRARERCLASCERFDVRLPQLIEWKLPGEAVLLAAAAEAAFIDDPTNRFEPLAEGMVDEAIADEPSEPIAARCRWRNIAKLLE